jgi:hypothetical protein
MTYVNDPELMNCTKNMLNILKNQNLRYKFYFLIEKFMFYFFCLFCLLSDKIDRPEYQQLIKYISVINR